MLTSETRSSFVTDENFWFSRPQLQNELKSSSWSYTSYTKMKSITKYIYNNFIIYKELLKFSNCFIYTLI